LHISAFRAACVHKARGVRAKNQTALNFFSQGIPTERKDTAVSFAKEVKNEICKIELDNICCARAELAGIVCFSASVHNNTIKFKTENAGVANRIYILIDFLYNIKIGVTLRQSGTFIAEMYGDEVIKILRDMRLATVPIRIEKNIIRNECCKMAFIRGAFLGGGSISSPSKGYHTEIATHHFALGTDFADVLNYFEIYPKVINRNGNYVFYLKDSEQIENLLAVIGAHTQMMEFLNVKIEKEVRNSTNRLVNCETANVDKTINASIAQRNAILKLQKNGGLEALSPELLELAKLRLENEDSSFAELSKMLGITKSGVNHRMRKIMEIANGEFCSSTRS